MSRWKLLILMLPLTGLLAQENAAVLSGAEAFQTYRASCHGKDGKEMGPAVAALKWRPPNLTLISMHNHTASSPRSVSCTSSTDTR